MREHKNILLEKIDGIYDIQPPAPPELTALEYSLFVTLTVFIVTVIIYVGWKLFFSNKNQYKRKISQLEKEFNNNDISSHDAVYQLCYLLQKGLKLNQLSRNTRPPKQSSLNSNKWESFILRLSDLRYKDSQYTNNEIQAAFKESLYWLKVWP